MNEKELRSEANKPFAFAFIGAIIGFGVSLLFDPFAIDFYTHEKIGTSVSTLIFGAIGFAIGLFIGNKVTKNKKSEFDPDNFSKD